MTTTINSFPGVTGQMPQLPSFGMPPQPFVTPDQQRIKALEDELAAVKAKLAEKDAASAVDLDKALSEVEGGGAFLRAKYDGVTKLVMEWALTNPMLQPKVTAFLDGWKKEAKAFLDGQKG